jgi:hypothetical protein
MRTELARSRMLPKKARAERAPHSFCLFCGRGGNHSARRVRAAIPPEAAGTRRADRGRGIGDAVSCGHRGDPGPRRGAGSQPEESWRAAIPPVAGEPAPRGRSPAGQDKSLHTVEDKNRAAHPPSGVHAQRSNAVVPIYLAAGAGWLAGGTMPFIRRYSTSWP